MSAPLRSMTGFARVRRPLGEGEVVVSVKTLNHRALDLHIHTRFNPGIEGVARMLMLFTFVPVAVALIWYFQRARWHRVITSLYAPQADGSGG